MGYDFVIKGRTMHKKLYCKTFVIGIIVLFIGVAVAHENVSIKNIQTSLEVIIDVTGDGRNFHITTYIRNNGDENVTIMLRCQPGGGFEIYNQNEELVYNSPKYVWPIMWELTLAGYQTEEIFNETWKGVDNNSKNLPSGKYSIKGIVFTDNGDIFSEPEDIYLEKAKSKNILSFLERFPILQRILQRLG